MLSYTPLTLYIIVGKIFKFRQLYDDFIFHTYQCKSKICYGIRNFWRRDTETSWI